MQVPFPTRTTSLNPPKADMSIDGSKRRRGGKRPLVRTFNIGVREHLTFDIARLFYSIGLPFNVAKNSYFIIIHICC